MHHLSRPLAHPIVGSENQGHISLNISHDGCRENQGHISLNISHDGCRENQGHISLSISHDGCRENQKTPCIFNNCF
jgi:hypothetical protein